MMKKCIIKNCIHCKKKNKRYICVKYSFENLNKDTICFEDVENKIWQNVIVSVDKKIKYIGDGNKWKEILKAS